MIWVVDEDPYLLAFLEASLVRTLGREVRRFENGSAAIAALAHTSPDVLLCDLELPGASGEEVAMAAARLSRPPFIVLMSGDTCRLDRALSLATLVLAKPFQLNELVWSIGTLCLRRSRMRAEFALRSGFGEVLAMGFTACGANGYPELQSSAGTLRFRR